MNKENRLEIATACVIGEINARQRGDDKREGLYASLYNEREITPCEASLLETAFEKRKHYSKVLESQSITFYKLPAGYIAFLWDYANEKQFVGVPFKDKIPASLR